MFLLLFFGKWALASSTWPPRQMARNDGDSEPTRRRTTRVTQSADASRKAAMQDLGRKREQQQAERASRPAASTGASAGSASALQYEDSGLTRAERSSWRKRTVRARESPDDSGEEFGEYSDSENGRDKFDKNHSERSAMESDLRMVEEGPSAEITDVERIRVGRNRLEQVINSRKFLSPCSAHSFLTYGRNGFATYREKGLLRFFFFRRTPHSSASTAAI